MTILASNTKAGTMEKLTDPVTSDSELEEGEIANDEIEIISEFIRHPTIKYQKLHSGKSENSVMPLRKLDSFTEDQLHSSKHLGSGSNIGGNSGKYELKHTSGLKPDQRSSREKSSVSSKRKSPPRMLKRLGQSRQRVNSNSCSRNRVSGSRSNRERGPSNQVRKEDKPCKSVTVGVGESIDKRWKQSFEMVTPGSVESMEESGSDVDEEIKLRLEALNSVVVNAKPKDIVNSDVVSSLSNSIPEPVISSGIQEEVEGDDEDEELLRAQLLIEVARKQTKDLEVQMQPELKDKRTDETPMLNPIVERRNPTAKVPQKTIHIPKADRLVIDLRDDSSDSSDDEENMVESSIAALLKTARQTVEEKSSAIPHALSHLPRNQQEEYQRLKQEILRRENQLLKQGASKVSTPIPTQLDNLPKDDSVHQPQDSGSISTVLEKTSLVSLQVGPFLSMDREQAISSPKPPVHVIKQSSVISPPSVPLGSSTKENEQNENVESSKKLEGALTAKSKATVSTPRVPDGVKTRSPMKTNESSSPKLVALKQQLLHKKRDLATTKEALKNQLGLVDKNRLLLISSSQEVSRLRALLQTAEVTEKQLRTQLTSSQLQTQRLKTKMQAVERQVTVLHSGIGTHRTRRMSAKFRSKLTAPSGLNSSANHFILPPLTPLRVKPRVFAKALAKTNHRTYRKPTEAAIDSAMSMSVKGAVQSKSKQTFTNVLEGNKILHDEQWLYGTLGDDWSHSTNVNSYPTWSSHGHTSRFL